MKLRHYLSILLALAAVAVVAGQSYFLNSDALGAMEVQNNGDGRVVIHRADETIVVGESPESLEAGDVVVTAAGKAKLLLEDNQKVLLGRKTRLRIRSGDAVEVQQGALLAFADGARTQVSFDDVTARFSSATFRLDRGFGSARAAAYEGRVAMESPGEMRLPLTRLLQVNVAAGDLPERSAPYRLDPSDEWDIEYLRSVVLLTQDLDGLVKGFNRQVGAARPGLEYFADLAGRDVGFMRRYMSRPVGDLLVAFTIALNNNEGSVKDSFERALAYLDGGASYGVAASLLNARSSALLAQLEELIVDTGAVAADGGTGEVSFGESTTFAGDGSQDDGNQTVASGETETVSGGVDGETNESIQDCANLVDCEVQDVQDEIPPGPAPEPEGEEPPEDEGLLPGNDDDGGLLGTGLLGGND